MYRVVQKILHKVLCTIILQPFAVDSQSCHQNASKDQHLPVNAKFVSVGFKKFFDKQPELNKCTNNVTLHVNMTLLTAEDRLPIKTLQTGKG